MSEQPQLPIRKIITGGQTGVDRAALDVAIELGIEHGGWCPKGRTAEDGEIPDVYNLRETKSDDPRVRTRRNIRDADATHIISRRPLTGGTALTEKIATKRGRDVMVISPDDRVETAQTVRDWLRAKHIETLNVAGPRASESPDIYYQAMAILLAILRNPS